MANIKRRRRSHTRNCQQKHRYETRDAAYAARRNIAKRYKGSRVKMQVYRCLKCRRYHLGSDAVDSVLRSLDRIRRDD